MQTARTEFSQALKAVANERGLDAAVILETIKQAIIAAYRRDAKEAGIDTEVQDFDVELNPVNGEARVFAWPIDEPDKREDVTPPGFGRIAAQTAKQVIHQKIREAEKGAIMDEFSGRVGALISGMILRFDGPNVRVDLGRTEAIMPAEERIANERLNLNQRLSFLLKDINETPKGKEIILSRADPAFVEKLFAREVPEIGSGNVKIESVAREPGVRTKIVVSSTISGIDPVGSCVGQKGVRVQAVTNELGGERVDIIPWSENIEDLVIAGLSPAEDVSVSLDEKNKTAKVVVPEDQLSLAIGRDGQNVRLVAKLTGYRIEVEGKKVKKKVSAKKEASAAAKETDKPGSEVEETEKKPTVKTKKPKKIKDDKDSEETEEIAKDDKSQNSKAEVATDKNES